MKYKKICMKCISMVLVICLSIGLSCVDVKAATFDDLNQPGIFVKQQTMETCTLASAVMLVRRAALANGNNNWAAITESKMRGTAWREGYGLWYNFTYAGITVAHASLSGTQQLINLLASHPEGIVVYNTSKPHAILITDYTNGTFYCADPAVGAKRIPVSQATITVGSCKEYWYVKSPKVSLGPAREYDAIASGNYYLINNDNNLFLNVLDGSGANKQNVLLAGYNGAEKFNMRIDYAASGSYIRPNFTSRVLNPFSDSVTSGVNVNIYDKSTDGTQLWMFKKVDTGYVIYNKANQGVVLSISGTNVIVENYKGTTWQTWSLVPVAEVEKWLCEKNGHTWDAGVVTKKPTATAEGEKSFTCSNCGATKTEAIEPTGQTELKITQHPKNMEATSGVVKFYIDAVGDGLTYQWYWRKNASSTWGICGFTGSKTDTVSVEAIAARDGYQYRCEVTDQYGNKLTSNYATLTTIPKAKITVQPKDVTVSSGTVKFSVTAVGDELTYQWYWRKNASSAWGLCGFTGSKTSTVSVEAIAARNGYQYQCVVTDKYGNTATSSAVQLNVISKATIISNPKDVTAASGNVIFGVTASGDGLTYQWYWRKNSSSEWGICGFTGNKTNALSVEAIAARNGFQYQCIVTDKYGNKATSTAATLKVISKATITKNPTSVSVYNGTVKFSVAATGDDIAYQWYWRKNSSSEWAVCGFTGNKTNTLSVEAIPARNGFQYQCVVTDKYGNKATSTAAVLTVNASAKVTQNPMNVSASSGTVRFYIVAEGKDLTYQWYWRKNASSEWAICGFEGNKTDTLKVEVIPARNGFQYRCVVKDGAGNTAASGYATLTVE